jgi:hypothetical protein
MWDGDYVVDDTLGDIMIEPNYIAECKEPVRLTHIDVQNHVVDCSYCQHELEKLFTMLAVTRAGSVKSEAKAKSSRLNGAKGGRPRKGSK